MKFFHKHAFSPIKGEQNIQPTGLFMTTPLFGPLSRVVTNFKWNHLHAFFTDIVFSTMQKFRIVGSFNWEFVSRIFLSLCACKRKQEVGPKQKISQFASWKRNHNKYFAFRRFAIRDWWNHLMNSLEVTKVSCSIIVHFL